MQVLRQITFSMRSEIIKKYFPDIDALQEERFEAMYGLYMDWNSRINVISRKDAEFLYVRHILHSLAIAKVCGFAPSARVMDVGTGGGFPGIPLAVLFPETEFTLVDSIAKKITVAGNVAQSLGLGNVRTVNGRAEDVNGKFDYVVSRAVTDMSRFIPWVWSKIEKGQRGTLRNGILYLKGGDLTEELAATGKQYRLFNISGFFGEDFFDTKKVVYIAK